ncbi:MAG TPA: peptidyl-prolyl cis-trans isomerase [Terracidiphilus sp.]|nr:peptidyl-prolyl cis-trans isomerase [Terracidiphilus sp.]
MKYKLSAFLLLAISTACAQVSSHAPTVVKQAPAQPAASTVPAQPMSPVVRVNGAVLTQADLVREEYTIFPYARQHGGLPKDLAPQIREGAMKMIIFEELVYQEAERRKMTVSPIKLQKAEADFRKQFSGPDEFNALLQTEFHGQQKLLDEKIRRSLLIDVFLKNEVESRSVVTPVEVKAFFDKNPARFHHPESFTFQTISVLPPASATADQLKEGRKRAESALQQAKATKTAEQFGLLAEKISDDDYRVVMGQHKPVPVDQLPPAVIKALKSMKLGDVSDLIQLDQAYSIVRLQQHTPAGQARFDDVKTQLAKELQQQKKEQLRSDLDKKLRQNAKIEQM